MIKNFIFDIDRTLVDSYRVELETLKKALEIVTRNTYEDAVMNKLTVLTTEEFFESLGIKTESDVMSRINHYWEIFLKDRQIQMFEGIRELLIELNEKGFFLAIATSRTRDELNELEELLKYIDLFDAVITSDQVSLPKPNPESINVIIDKFGLDVQETIYIGDSEGDSVAAKRAGVAFGYASWENKNGKFPFDYLFLEPRDICKIYK